MENSKEHWQKVYETKKPDEVSWTQVVPETSLAFIRSFQLPKPARIIDIGGGDSKLVDYLLEEGFEHITVLDISQEALTRAKNRLGANAKKITWIAEDVRDFKPLGTFDLWHDRAAFHFLTDEADIAAYVRTLIDSLVPGGYLVMGTFAENGPEKCSGLPVQRYSETSLAKRLGGGFQKIGCLHDNHITPFGTTQDFLFCSFQKTE
ncbi:MAG TPA: class I SAM-dependent methyltransferase [Chitinophagaceae bacterium]|nr:class I SAM-dependent methyltransferase [Chitinophagaceae bacterium]